MTKAMRLFGILAVAALVLVATSAAMANCIPNKTAGQLSDINAPQTTLFPGAVQNVDSGQIIGRFWQPGFRSSRNEGTYTTAMWFPAADVIGLPGNIMYAFFGEADVAGCPADTLITVLQSPYLDGDGASFVVARVNEWFVGGALDFDYTQTSTEAAGWVGKPVAKPAVTSVKVPGTRQFNLTATGPSVGDLFYGEPGMLPEATIVARRLYQFIGPGAVGSQRDPHTTAWTYTNQRLTGVVGGVATLPTLNCDSLGAGQDYFLAWALEFQDGVVSDYVGKAQQIVCNSGLAAPGKFKNIDKRQGPKDKTGR